MPVLSAQCLVHRRLRRGAWGRKCVGHDRRTAVTLHGHFDLSGLGPEIHGDFPGAIGRKIADGLRNGGRDRRRVRLRPTLRDTKFARQFRPDRTKAPIRGDEQVYRVRHRGIDSTSQAEVGQDLARGLTVGANLGGEQIQ